MATRKAQQSAKRGRPSKYHDGIPDQARKLCLAGWTDKQMADFFGVGEATFNRWKTEFPEFRESLKAKALADVEVAASLFQRAVGYSHADVHITSFQGVAIITPITKHYPPDPTSMIFWLKNRQPAVWREKPDPDDSQAPVQPVQIIVQVEDASRPEAE